MAGLFREDIEAAFSLESIEARVVPGRTELLSAQNLTYVAFVDPSGGRCDQFTVTVAHRSGDKAVVDMIRAWEPPIDPAEVTKECAEVLSRIELRPSPAMHTVANGRASSSGTQHPRC
jgi:hypothetical protein